MCQIQDRLCGCGGVLQLWPQSVDVECCDQKSVSGHVQFKAKCRETTRQSYGYQSLSEWSELAFSLL